MTGAVLDRPRVTQGQDGQGEPDRLVEPRRTPAHRARSWFEAHGPSLAWLLPVLAIGGVVHAWGMDGAPQRVDDEGTYVAQAYAVQHFGELAHYTYWYDHPPLGWLQLAAWNVLTGGFYGSLSAVDTGRVAMVAADLVSAALLFLLVRRVGLARPTAAAAAAIFLLSPLAVAYHRMVYLDNIATPWLIGALVLACPRRHQLLSFAGGAVCFAVAVLSKETYLLLLPVFAWWMLRNSDRGIRRYTLTIAGTLVVLCGAAYLVFAALRGELFPGSGHVSLVDGVRFQLLDRTSSGSVLDPTSQSRDTLRIWFGYDSVLPVAATLASLALLWSRRLRPLAVGFLLPAVMLLRPGYLPVPYVVAMIPFAALSVAAAVEIGVRGPAYRRSAAVLAGVVAVALAVPVWAGGLRTLTTDDLDRPMASAEAWLLANAKPQDRLLVDDAVWVDLVRSGLPRDHVIWYYKADTDPEVMRLTPHGWRDYDYILVTESTRRSLATEGRSTGGGTYPVLANAIRHARTVASYGKGNDRVDVRRVIHRKEAP